MNPITRFDMEHHAGPYESWPLRSRLILDGHLTKRAVPGYKLLHQFEVFGGYLLITDYDCLFEEATNFVLLNNNLRLLARRSLGAPYASLLLKDIKLIDDRRLMAIFDGDDCWCLIVRSWGIPYLRPRLKLQRCRGAEPCLAADALKRAAQHGVRRH